jgi:hypothetical protein
MRRAKPDEVPVDSRPIATANLSEAELLAWMPIPFTEVNDLMIELEPALAALVQLDSGRYIYAVYYRESHFVTIDIPVNEDINATLADFFREVPLLRRRVTWHRDDSTLPAEELRRAVS